MSVWDNSDPPTRPCSWFPPWLALPEGAPELHCGGVCIRKVERFAYVPLPFSTEKQLEAKGGPIHHLFYGRTLNLDTRIGAFHSKIKEEIPLTYQGQSPSKWTWEGILFMDWKHFHYSYSTRPFQMQKSSLSDIKCNCKTDLEIIYWRKKWGVTTVPDLLSFFYLESSQPFIWRESQVNKF